MLATKLRLAVVVAGLGLAVTACNNPYSPGQRAAGGALLGAGGGAAVGALAGGGQGALIGAGVGALGGAAIGAATTPERPRRGGYYRGY
ncbi:YMGG-like glycine zipper-containing protein [Roseococcus pinisoli]|uniref:Cell envelope biogenesis protein OmpA n=1 Tax=Roseococcus pinisoli TaxID=2835040 RepID=A0ABS5QGZ8_9PROT|nr:YMGG-like glycine zipper-containing protein [Roseococcus pinisoli]MBS7812916.1 cell envelope biogenesis protein OmpA [Roseococcus pinisoli]